MLFVPIFQKFISTKILFYVKIIHFADDAFFFLYARVIDFFKSAILFNNFFLVSNFKMSNLHFKMYTILLK